MREEVVMAKGRPCPGSRIRSGGRGKGLGRGQGIGPIGVPSRAPSGTRGRRR